MNLLQREGFSPHAHLSEHANKWQVTADAVPQDGPDRDLLRDADKVGVGCGSLVVLLLLHIEEVSLHDSSRVIASAGEVGPNLAP